MHRYDAANGGSFWQGLEKVSLSKGRPMKTTAKILPLRRANGVLVGLVSLVAFVILVGCGRGVETEGVKEVAENFEEYAEPSVPPYDEEADGRQQLEEGLARAQEEGKRVFVVWGANWCSMCRHLAAEFEEDEKVRALVEENYVEVKLDIGMRDKHMDLAREYGLEFDELGIPYLSILDVDGGVVARLDGDGIFKEVAAGDGLRGTGNEYLRGKISEFLGGNTGG